MHFQLLVQFKRSIHRAAAGGGGVGTYGGILWRTVPRVDAHLAPITPVPLGAVRTRVGARRWVVRARAREHVDVAENHIARTHARLTISCKHNVIVKNTS